MDLARARSPFAVLDVVRSAEESDPHGLRWPDRLPLVQWLRQALNRQDSQPTGSTIATSSPGSPPWTSSTHGPFAVLDVVRSAEESDPHGLRWPRGKRHDDQALAWVDFR